MGMKILRYLTYSKNLNLRVKNTNISKDIVIEAYSDADWAQDKEDRKSVSGTYIVVNGAPIVWRTKKQTTVSLSTMEAEYVAIVDAVKIMLGIFETLMELELKVKLPMQLYCDNQATIAQATNEASTERNKHMDLRLKFIQELVREKKIQISYVSTKEQAADIFTKALAKPAFEENLKKLNLF